LVSAKFGTLVTSSTFNKPSFLNLITLENSTLVSAEFGTLVTSSTFNKPSSINLSILISKVFPAKAEKQL
jgi:tetrahydromethanopterin S-methyltransferase subunit E